VGYYSGSNHPSGSAMAEWKRGASLDTTMSEQQVGMVEGEQCQQPTFPVKAQPSEAPAAATVVERSVEVR
jgi:hypothetical protein